jgi:hypothetical protein|tara:strand:+ start:616 stop:1038 length:423 start_codon:yes stop_codon:yes gene_type:complete
LVIFKKIISLKKNKPDSVVWDDTQENYIAKLLPYASNISGPIIEVPNVDAFKKKGVDKVSKQFQAELSDLNEKIKSFVSLATDTQEVYSAHFKFEPIVGETYHLYKGVKESFLSLIPPEHWGKEHLGSFRLNGDYKWERL